MVLACTSLKYGSKLMQEHKDEVGMSWEHEQEAAANKRVDIDNGGVIMMKRKL